MFLRPYMIQKYMPDTQTDSPPLSEEEIAAILEFYAHPEEHKTTSAEEFIKELNEAVD